MKYTIVRVTEENYALFDDMVFFRMNGRDRTPDELAQHRDSSAVFAALADKNLRVYAAQSCGRFVGWVSAAYIPKVGKYNGSGHLFIDELWTAPEYRRHGIAYALMAEAERAALEMNAAGLRLYVGAGNPHALALYTKCGFRDRGDDAHFMDKEWDA